MVGRKDNHININIIAFYLLFAAWNWAPIAKSMCVSRYMCEFCCDKVVVVLLADYAKITTIDVRQKHGPIIVLNFASANAINLAQAQSRARPHAKHQSTRLAKIIHSLISIWVSITTRRRKERERWQASFWLASRRSWIRGEDSEFARLSTLIKSWATLSCGCESTCLLGIELEL